VLGFASKFVNIGVPAHLGDDICGECDSCCMLVLSAVKDACATLGESSLGISSSGRSVNDGSVTPIRLQLIAARKARAIMITDNKKNFFI
jgi:hypothetical protein